MEKNHSYDFENYKNNIGMWLRPAPCRPTIYNNTHSSFLTSIQQWDACKPCPINDNDADIKWISINVLICQ